MPFEATSSSSTLMSTEPAANERNPPATPWPITAVSSLESVSSAVLTVTVCSAFQLPVVKVSAPDTVISVSPLVRDGVTVTGAVGSVSSTTVYVSLSPSAISRSDSETVSPRVSSSSSVSVTSGGSTMSSVLLAVPFTVTLLSASSTSLFTPVIVTAPVLEVEPAAMVSTLLVLRE